MRKINLIRFIDSNTSKQEDEEIYRWLEASPQNRRYFDNLKSLWILSALPQERVEESEYLKFKSKYSIKAPVKRRTHYLSVAVIAASLLFLLYILNPYLSNSGIKKDLISNTGQEIQYYNLPDSSRVALFPKAQIEYNKDEYLKNRSVVLVNGEAFFEIKSNHLKPFHVYTKDDIDIKVTGTKFLLNSVTGKIKQDNKFEAFLTEGKISVKWIQEDGEITMLPGDMVIVNGSMELVKVSNPISPKNLELLNSYFCFENTIMKEVLRKIENYYNVKIVCNRAEIANFLFTGDLNNENIDSILALFNHSMDIQSTKRGENIILY